jgi:hypothetical protein
VRSLVAFVLLLIACLLVPVAVVGWWAHDAVIPADGYVETVAPLATDPAVVDDVEDRLVTATLQRIAAAPGSSTVSSTGAAEPLVRSAVGRAVADPAFARAWEAANRVLHTQVIGILSGDTPTVRSGSMAGLQLAPISGAVRAELGAAGVPFADRLPTVQATLPLVPTDDLVRARGVYRVVDDWGRVLPFIVLALVALGALVARRGARAVAWTAIGALVALGLLAVALLVGRFAATAVLPSSVSTPVGHALYDTVTGGLWRDALVAAGIALLLVVSVLLVGSALEARARRR